MKTRIFLAVILLCIYYVGAEKSFRVVSFNTWQMGLHVEEGMEKLAKHILALEPDIVSLQEVQTPESAQNLTSLLPEGWTIIYANKLYPDVALLTKHRIIEESVENTTAGIHARIELPDGQQVSFWAYHGFWRAYGPYAAFNRLVTNLSQILDGEHVPLKSKIGRAENVKEILKSRSMAHDLSVLERVPIIIAGDFNSPSHLDWTNETSHLHGDWVVPWPSTEILMENGFIDAYREEFPDPISHPGLTWSTVCKENVEWEYAFPEPQDRLDFIFYRGHVKPLRTELYAGNEPLEKMPNHKMNDFPSDHYVIYTDFEISRLSNAIEK
ncbi:unnamed protein product, partial [Mesorhabditis spiculigera]